MRQAVNTTLEKLLKIAARPGPLDRSIRRILRGAWVSYVAILLLQAKVIWGMWPRRDLTTGDTSSYFVFAHDWVTNFNVHLQWSPLYTAFYGTVFMLTNDTYVATILHRVIIVFASTLGVLAVMRMLLPPMLALLIAAWWAVLPINFETLYEVHLFGLLPILAAWLIAGTRDDARHRGAALAVLVATSVLVRNEMTVAVVIYFAICILRERRDFRKPHPPGAAGKLLAAYAVPMLVALTICLFFYWRSVEKFPQLLDTAKHTVNMCQVYAFGFQQRTPSWVSSPWLDCQPLIRETFGLDSPSLWQMIKANPGAVYEHFLWNISLIPSGFQMGLFDMMSGAISPDYVPAKQNGLATILSAITLATVVLGIAMAIFGWRDRWKIWFSRRRGLFLIFAAVLCVAVPVILTQRPRPSYLFSTTFIMMATIGTAVNIITYRWSAVAERVAIILAALVMLIIPPYYSEGWPRPLYDAHERVKPYASLFRGAGNTIIFGDYYGELEGYLLLHRTHPKLLDYQVLSSRPPEEGLDAFLRRQGVNIVYAQPRIGNSLRAAPEGNDLLDRPETLGWRRIAPSATNPPWFLLCRPKEGQSDCTISLPAPSRG